MSGSGFSVDRGVPVHQRRVEARRAPAALVLLVVLALAVVWLGGVFPAGPAAAQDAQRIAAVVNEEIISVHDLNTRISLLLATSDLENRPENRQRVALAALRSLIDDKLKLQEARRLKLSVTQAEIETTLASIARQIRIPPAELPRFLASKGTTLAALIEQVEAELAWVKAVRRGMQAQAEIGTEEIEATLQRMIREAGKPEYRVAEIFLSVEDPASEPEVRALAERLVQQIVEGANFPALARNFSEAASAAVGGDLGYIRPDQLPVELQDAVEKLEPGRLAPPIRTLTGYHIIAVLDKRVASNPGETKTVVSLQQIVLPLSPDPSPTEVDGEIARAGEIAARTATCADLEAVAKELGLQASGGIRDVELAQLAEPLKERVGPLQPGEKTEPLRTPGGVVLLMVCDRRDEAAGPEVRERIKEALENERMAVTSRRLLRDLRREAFVDIRI